MSLVIVECNPGKRGWALCDNFITCGNPSRMVAVPAWYERAVAAEKAAAWDGGYEIGALDHSFEVRGSHGDPDAHEFPHAYPYRTIETKASTE